MASRGSVTQLLEPVRDAAKRGEMRQAHEMLHEVEAKFPLSEDVLALKAAIAATDEEAAAHLARIVELNPKNEKALRDLALMRLGASSRMHTAVQAAIPGEFPCPLCKHVHGSKFDSCLGCGAISDPRRVLEMINNEGADPEVVRAAIARREKKGTADSTCAAALGALNLREVSQAYAYARKALELDPSHVGAGVLARRLEEPVWILAVTAAMPVRRALLTALEPAPCLVRVAAGPESAKAALQGLNPKAVIADSQYPGGGLAFCQTVRSLEGGAELPLVLLGGGMMDKLRARSAGVTAHVAVPFNTQTLMAALKAVPGLT